MTTHLSFVSHTVKILQIYNLGDLAIGSTGTLSW